MYHDLAQALQAPLVALGVVDKCVLSGHEWAQPWADLAVSDELRQNIDVFAEYLGPWFGRSVVAKAAALIVKNDMFKTVVEPYISRSTELPHIIGWNVLAATLDILVSRSEAHRVRDVGSMLTLATRVISNSVTSGIADPRRFLRSTNLASAAARSRWAEYLQTACSLPERLANRVDPHDIPHSLRPLPYFQRLAQQAVAASNEPNYRPMVAELWAKLCRVGQTDTLGVEIAAAMIPVPSTEDQPDSSSENSSMSIARMLALVPIPFKGRLISGLMRQFDIALKVSDPKELGPCVAICICALFHGQIDSGESSSSSPASDEKINSVISDLITRSGADLLAPRWESMAMYQAMALALQLLAGKGHVEDDTVSNLLTLVPARVYPNLLKNALLQVIIPLWSFGEFITHAPAGDIKAMTALVLMCVGALSEQECKDLVTSIEFMQAVPRFLDSLTPVSKLSGIIVADRIVRLSKTMGDSSLDFGIDDIIRDAKRSNRPEIQASAQYIADMEQMSRPPLDQWKSAESPLVASSSAVEYMRSYNGSTDTLISTRDSDNKVFAPRTSSLTDNGASTALQSSFVKPRKPVFLRDCITYMREPQDGNTELPTIGLFAAVECIEKASEKALDELWVQMATRILYTYNRGSDDLDLEWNTERRRALVALAVRIPERVGPYLADRSCDRNLTLKDREIVYSAIATACLQLSGLDQDPASKSLVEEVPESPQKSLSNDVVGTGTVVRRSRRLDIVAADAARLKSSRPLAQQRYASYVGPSFFFPLVSQYGKSDMASDTTSDVRRDASQLERFVNTLAIVLYTAGSATHQITMNREFWDLCRLIRRQLGNSSNLAPPVVDAILFGIDVILSPERALSTPTLAREFRMDIADMLQWIDELVGSGVLRGPAMGHASRIVHRLQEIQGDVSRRMMSDDFNQFSSII
ncbi:telomere binding protein [Coemansia interrupta]|uniref:Telomere binding protein n=1 Tax=Coemansia interrupta TaxID=1126814 RepID=A0A9W8LGK5_9FUNG|nr:telomere binding protein [Coemansia interrupta]